MQNKQLSPKNVNNKESGLFKGSYRYFCKNVCYEGHCRVKHSNSSSSES